jgi:hypothetical protein
MDAGRCRRGGLRAETRLLEMPGRWRGVGDWWEVAGEIKMLFVDGYFIGYEVAWMFLCVLACSCVFSPVLVCGADSLWDGC